MKYGLLVVICALALTGCVNQAEEAQKECVALGAQPGTPVYINCYQQSMMRRQSRMNAAMMSD